MHVVELIPVAEGHWAAHCAELQSGSLAHSRSAAVVALNRIIACPEKKPAHPEFHPDGHKTYPLPEPGYYSF
ncbi:MAG: hypothetical protein KDK34_11740 [Leptospiraceae bacterium]|nr:hypothetical protein [Leptospiraceae bacterium]MCB1320919.1 hypothetical protein [Leptospiraceae bacterium]